MPKKLNIQRIKKRVGKYVKNRDRKFWIAFSSVSMGFLLLVGLLVVSIGGDQPSSINDDFSSQLNPEETQSNPEETQSNEDEAELAGNSQNGDVTNSGPAWGDQLVYRPANSFEDFYFSADFFNPSTQSGTCRFVFQAQNSWSRSSVKEVVREIDVVDSEACTSTISVKDLNQITYDSNENIIWTYSFLDSNGNTMIPEKTTRFNMICVQYDQQAPSADPPVCRNEDGTTPKGKPFTEYINSNASVRGSSIDEAILYADWTVARYNVEPISCMVEGFVNSVSVGDTTVNPGEIGLCEGSLPLKSVPGLIGLPGTKSEVFRINFKFEVQYEQYDGIKNDDHSAAMNVQCEVRESSEDVICKYGGDLEDPRNHVTYSYMTWTSTN